MNPLMWRRAGRKGGFVVQVRVRRLPSTAVAEEVHPLATGAGEPPRDPREGDSCPEVGRVLADAPTVHEREVGRSFRHAGPAEVHSPHVDVRAREEDREAPVGGGAGDREVVRLEVRDVTGREEDGVLGLDGLVRPTLADDPMEADHVVRSRADPHVERIVEDVLEDRFAVEPEEG